MQSGRFVKVCVGFGVLCATVLISGCSPEARARGAAQSFDPAVYGGIALINFGVGRVGGVDEGKVDEKNYKIVSRTNPVTSSRQAFELALVHAAKIGEANQFTQFKIQKDRRRVRCSNEGGAPMVDLRVLYGRADEQLSGDHVYQVATVLAELWDKVNTKSVNQTADSKAYLQNVRDCQTGTREYWGW